MGFIFTTQKKENTIAVFDIGSGSVGGAIIKLPLNNNGIPIIIKSIREDIKSRGVFNFESFTKDMILTLGKVANSLYAEKLGAPSEIHCVMASPWYLSETRVIKMKKEKSFTFDKDIASELIEKEIQGLTADYKNKYGESNDLPEVIEQYTMMVSLNGYQVEDPIGKKCQFLDMNMVISLSPASCINKIKEALSKTFHHTKVSFSTFTVDAYLAVRDKYVAPDSYLLLDVSGELTDVGIVTKGILKSALSFPFGKKTFFKQICQKLKIEQRDAEELFKLYSENNLSSTFKEKMIPVFESIENSWMQAFEECIETLPRTLILPNTIFLTADNDIKNWFSNVLLKEDHVQITTSEHKSTVITLDGQEFLNMCDVKNGACDPFIMIEAIAIMRKMVK